MAKLTAKRARFIEEYLIDLNATQAAIRAGYAAKRADQIGYELLRKPEIHDAIQAAMRKRSAETGITAERVITEIARLAFSNARDIMSWGPDGVVLKDSSTLTPDQVAAVVEVSETKNANGGSIKVKLADKISALDKLCRHLGIYDAGSTFDLSKLSDDDLEKIARGRV